MNRPTVNTVGRPTGNNSASIGEEYSTGKTTSANTTTLLSLMVEAILHRVYILTQMHRKTFFHPTTMLLFAGLYIS